MERIEAINAYYESYDEDHRLTVRHGMVEFLTTVHYIERYLKPGMRILEIGAGTGGTLTILLGKVMKWTRLN